MTSYIPMVCCTEQKTELQEHFPRLKDVLELREDTNGAFTWFLDKMLQNVARKRHWIKARAKGSVPHNVAVSDEAYALWILENNWSFWTNAYNSPNIKNYIKESLKNKTDSPECTRNEKKMTSKFCGVTDKGITRFNELHASVTNNRNRNEAHQFKLDYKTGKSQEKELANESAIKMKQLLDEKNNPAPKIVIAANDFLIPKKKASEIKRTSGAKNHYKTQRSYPNYLNDSVRNEREDSHMEKNGGYSDDEEDYEERDGSEQGSGSDEDSFDNNPAYLKFRKSAQV